MTSYTTWSPEYSSGVPALDQLHHELFETLDKLSRVQDDDFSNGYNALVGQMERAFQEEEQWMEEMSFHSLQVHREQHARVLGALHHVHSRVMGGEVGVGREVVNELLPQWLAFHMSTMDATLARAMQLAHARTVRRANNMANPAPAAH